MNKTTNYGAGLALAMALAIPIVGAPAHATIFGPVSAQTQKADSGMILGFTETHQSYTEFPPTAGLPNPLDTQTGTVPGIEIGYQKQDAHIGWGVTLNENRGHTTYNGYTQNSVTGVLTPDTAQTMNAWGDINGWFDVGFAPSATPNLSFMPGLLVGLHSWDRNNSANPGGYSENYNGYYAAVRLLTQYAIGPVVFGLTTDAGRTLRSQMNSGLDGETYILGNGPWTRLGFKVTYNMFSAMSVFVSYSRTTFSYGQSSVHADGYMEPNSKTVNNATEAGLDIHF
ncbi:MAG: hypothetical protein ACYDEV_00075 [Acidiferrobacter sp.]